MAASPWLDRLLDVALSPSLWLGVALALVYSTLFTAWYGRWRGWRRDLLAGLVGFGAGQAVGVLLGSTWLRIGGIHFLWGTLATVAALLAGRWLAARRQAIRESKDVFTK